jgi:AraC-like DNA-binding protein
VRARWSQPWSASWNSRPQINELTRQRRAANPQLRLEKTVSKSVTLEVGSGLVQTTFSSQLLRAGMVKLARPSVGVSPVYLTQVFQQVEGMPLYRYQLRLRLARALDLLGQYEDLSTLSMDLGFSSHSHFSSAFRQAYGRTPAEFRRSAHLR